MPETQPLQWFAGLCLRERGSAGPTRLDSLHLLLQSNQLETQNFTPFCLPKHARDFTLFLENSSLNLCQSMGITMIFQALYKLVPTYLSRVLLNLIGHSVLALAREWWLGVIYGSREGLEGGWGTKMYRMPARCHYFISSSGTRSKYNFVHCIAEGTRKCEPPLLSVL